MHTLTLHEAIHNRNIAQVQRLIADGRSLNTPIGTKGFYPLHHVAFLGLPGMLALMLGKGASVNQLSTAENESALHLTVKPQETKYTQDEKNNKLQCLALLLKQKPSILDHCNTRGYSALGLAIYHNFQEAAECLNAAKAKRSPTHPLASIAAMQGHLACLTWVLSLHPDNSSAIEPSTGMTALHHAAKNNNLACLRLLLQHNPALLTRSKKNDTAFLLVLSKLAGNEAMACALFTAHLRSAKPHHALFNKKENAVLRSLTAAQKFQLEMSYAPVIAQAMAGVLHTLIPELKHLIAEYAALTIDELVPSIQNIRSSKRLFPW